MIQSIGEGMQQLKLYRLHQGEFRIRVLSAYKEQCAFCRLRHQQLLDAAHIIPDGEDGGEPIVPNGLSLCKIHHAAFDNNIVGLNPDYKIIVREDILEEIDGPMLKYGIQEMHEQKIEV
jgi:putative restriction endonuclease